MRSHMHIYRCNESTLIYHAQYDYSNMWSHEYPVVSIEEQSTMDRLMRMMYAVMSWGETITKGTPIAGWFHRKPMKIQKENGWELGVPPWPHDFGKPHKRDMNGYDGEIIAEQPVWDGGKPRIHGFQKLWWKTWTSSLWQRPLMPGQISNQMLFQEFWT